MKKKIVSKVFALLLAACTVLSACGNESGNQSVGQTDKSETNDTVQEGEEPYTIVYAFDVWVQQADWDLVEENLSNIVYDKIGAKVKLLPMTGANYQQEVNLMITSGEKLDLVMHQPELHSVVMSLPINCLGWMKKRFVNMHRMQWK